MNKFKEFLTETKKKLNENFIGVKDIESMSPGPDRDMQILRLSIIAELDASNLYEKFARLADNDDLKTILLDISNEEKEHFGEFEYLLEEIDPDFEEAEESGEEEAEELVGDDYER